MCFDVGIKISEIAEMIGGLIFHGTIRRKPKIIRITKSEMKGKLIKTHKTIGKNSKN